MIKANHYTYFSKLGLDRFFKWQYYAPFNFRGIAQSGSAPALGAGCREFESLYPDQFVVAVAQLVEHRIVTPEVAGSRPVGHPMLRVLNCWLGIPAIPLIP